MHNICLKIGQELHILRVPDLFFKNRYLLLFLIYFKSFFAIEISWVSFIALCCTNSNSSDEIARCKDCDLTYSFHFGKVEHLYSDDILIEVDGWQSSAYHE